MAHYGAIESSRSAKSKSKAKAVVEETSSLVSRHNSDDGEDVAEHEGISTRYLTAFYASHALFMWNNRCYEFAALLFTSAAFPHTLTAASIRGFCAHLASVLFSPAVGRWINQKSSRLRPVQGCILVQRACIALACVGFLPLIVARESRPDEKQLLDRWSHAVPAVFAVLIVLGMVERLSAVGNFAIVEREWLPLLATRRVVQEIEVHDDDHGGSSSTAPRERTCSTKRLESNLHILNATTKRIDLVTKLVAPLVISQLTVLTDSVRLTGIILAGTQLLSCGVEIYCTHLVWKHCAALREPRAGKDTPLCDHSLCTPDEPELTDADPSISATDQQRNWPVMGSLRIWFSSFSAYLKDPISLPSLAYVLEPFSVLTLAGSMTAYLLAANFSLEKITIARTASTIVEISSTVLTPMAISCVSSRGKSNAADGVRPLVTVGIAGLSWQLICLIPVTVLFMAFPALNGTNADAKYGSITILLFAGLALSRLGPFAYSLVEQQLVQVKVPEDERVEVSSVETALFDVSELARWCMLMIFASNKQFRWAALLSLLSVALSLAMVLVWVKRNRKEVRHARVQQNEH